MNKNNFMVEIILPSILDEKFANLIPSQRALVNNLFENGTLLSYSVSSDRSKLWTIVAAKTEKEVMDILSEFPIMPYVKVEIQPLLFHNTVAINEPFFSLN
ncbi:MAG: hypothetical protein J0M08_09865 [Bacteroidetes bacterium]|nr:hypothetical protein [Bacteroidota bacterium]